MPQVALVSDSTAGLTAEFVEQHDIRVAPLYVKIGDQTYRDGVDMTPQAFYELLPQLTELPTTSQPSVGDFQEIYGQLAREGAEAIISIHLSSGISGTVNAARLAAEQMGDLRIEIVDTQSAAAAHLLAVEAGAAAAAAGLPLSDCLAAVNGVLDAQRLYFTVDSLEYLHKGGRIGGAAALLGSLLQFKPILCFEAGRITALERVRKSDRALARMVGLMADHFGRENPLEAVIMQAACPERAEALEPLLCQGLTTARVRTMPLTPVIGAHVGNGTLGLCCCPSSLLAPQ